MPTVLQDDPLALDSKAGDVQNGDDSGTTGCKSDAQDSSSSSTSSCSGKSSTSSSSSSSSTTKEELPDQGQRSAKRKRAQGEVSAAPAADHDRAGDISGFGSAGSDEDSSVDLKLAEAVKNGPSSIQELFGWPHAAVEQLFRLGDAAGDADAVRLKGLRLVMTSDFSGMGTAELAVGMVLDAVKKHVATGETDGPLFLPYAAADISDVCRSFITSHSHPPLHIFGDLFGRLSKSALDGLAQKEELVNEVLQETCEKEKENLQMYGEQLLQAHMDTLSRPGSLLSKAKCDVHGKACPLPHSGLPMELHKQCQSEGCTMALSLNASGTECYDYSSMGEQKGLLGRTAKTFAVWVEERKRSAEDLLLHECTVRFRPAVLRQHLGHIYIFFSLIISPHHLGWPVHRPRRYTIGVKKGTLLFDHERFGSELNQLLRKPSVDCGILYCKTDTEETDIKMAMSKRYKKASQNSHFFSLLPAAKQKRVKFYRELPKVKQWLDEGKEVAVDLEQRPGSFPMANYLLPTLLRGSSMYLLQRGAPLSGQDLMMVMGIPVPCRDHVHHMPGFFKGQGKGSSLSSLNDRAIKSLTGNAMHSCVVGCLVLCMLRNARPQPQ